MGDAGTIRNRQRGLDGVVEVITKASMDFFTGTLNGVAVVVVRSGIGKVNAALCVQVLCHPLCRRWRG